MPADEDATDIGWPCLYAQQQQHLAADASDFLHQGENGTDQSHTTTIMTTTNTATTMLIMNGYLSVFRGRITTLTSAFYN